MAGGGKGFQLVPVVALLGLAGLLAWSAAGTGGRGLLEAFAVLVVALLAGLAANVVGRLLCARELEMTVLALRLGPFVWMPADERGGPRLWWAPPTWAGALASSFDPRSPERLGPRHIALMVAGPAASMLLGVLLLAAAAVLPDHPVLWAAGLAVMALGAVELVPWRVGDRWSEGYWVWAWLRRPASAVRRVAFGVLARGMAAPGRGEDGSRPWLGLLEYNAGPPTGPHEVLGCWIAACRFLDAGRLDQAELWLSLANGGRALVGAGWPARLPLDLALVAARRGRVEEARRWLSEAGDVHPQLKLELACARAALRLADGHPSEALEECERSLAIAEEGWVERAGDNPDALHHWVRAQLVTVRAEALRRLTSTA